MFKTIIAVLAVLFVCLGVFTILDPNVSLDFQNGINNIVSIKGDMITVSISGEVVTPGSYVISEEGTLNDLISLAGGVTDKADPNAYILSCELKDGQNYYIAPRVESTDVCEPVVINKVNINTADKETLMTVQGIGSTIAQAIIDYREQNGQFTFLEQLLEVTGIGNATFEKIKNYICLS